MEQDPRGKPMGQLIPYLSTSQPGHPGKNTITFSRKTLQIRQKHASDELNYQNPTYPTLVLQHSSPHLRINLNHPLGILKAPARQDFICTLPVGANSEDTHGGGLYTQSQQTKLVMPTQGD